MRNKGSGPNACQPNVFQPPVFLVPNFAYNLVSSLLQFSNILIGQAFHNERNSSKNFDSIHEEGESEEWRRKGSHPISPSPPVLGSRSNGTLLISSAEPREKGANQPLRVSNPSSFPSLRVVWLTLLSSGERGRTRNRLDTFLVQWTFSFSC